MQFCHSNPLVCGVARSERTKSIPFGGSRLHNFLCFKGSYRHRRKWQQNGNKMLPEQRRKCCNRQRSPLGCFRARATTTTDPCYRRASKTAAAGRQEPRIDHSSFRFTRHHGGGRRGGGRAARGQGAQTAGGARRGGRYQIDAQPAARARHSGAKGRRRKPPKRPTAQRALHERQRLQLSSTALAPQRWCPCTRRPLRSWLLA